MRTIGEVIQNPFEIVRAIRIRAGGNVPLRDNAATTGHAVSAFGGALFPYSPRQSNRNFLV
jgi:hypothetical protein